MVKDLSPNASDIQQLAALWEAGCKTSHSFPSQDDERWQTDTLFVDSFSFDSSAVRMDDSRRQESIKRFRDQLVADALDPAQHFESLDSAISDRLVCRFQHSTLDSKVSSETAVNNAQQLLLRLPAVPLQIDLTSMLWGNPSEAKPLIGYLINETYIDERSVNPRSAWAQLTVVSLASSAVQKLALLVTNSGNARYSLGVCIRSFVDYISELIDEASNSRSKDECDVLGNSIVNAFLWTTWQRSIMLLYWFVLKTHLAFGYDREWDSLLALRGCSQLMNPSIRATLYGYANQNHVSMCSWAFKLLRSSRASIGLDFRRFHERFAALHRDKGARCQFESDGPCDGGHPLSCGRFLDKRLVQEEQSLHDETCSGSCKKVVWDEKSYIQISGPTAIAVQKSSRKVTYTQANEHTLAISHVWSHGQGSRPHIGINRCLHERYIGIAKASGCRSYWIDSMCIPDAHDLRSEAIGFINRIFTESKITLVCDKDLMGIDISTPTRELLESILATFFVCDWNVRAWTLLEAMKGSHAIHLLCKSNRIISLRDILTEIHQTGSVDISILCLAAQHLIPSSTDSFGKRSSRQSTEVAGSLLSHRHATRENDDIVIWSLLSSTRVFGSAEEMWRSKIRGRIATAYLISNTPRLTVRGFSWAPKTPYVRLIGYGPSQDLLGPYNSFEGSNSEIGQITSRGLVAEWLVYHLALSDAPLYQDAPVTMVSLSISGERTETILPGHRIRNNCWATALSFRDEYKHVVLIQPLVDSGSKSYDAAKNRGESHGDVFAICASHNQERWTWKAVQAWPSAVPLPLLVTDELLIE